ncbi:keratin, type I cytoskeletal 18-like isoform X1 [Mugil cephalus]|uniref:keratin, type I cytoskeletal 18-like isoform X1 n=1 Tax=Mugil cephalus TaxID=48193 RepID=UPI001FB6E7F7|nr:keratin, type I cytoskeletal 18-like isoform X1 [Mugil cephalus]
MPSNTAASMFGGAGGRGARASVASLEGLRSVLRNDTAKDAAPAPQTAPAPAASQAPEPPAVPADDKKTLRGLNDRLSGYLGRVKDLQEANRDLKKEIDDILAKRQAPESRNWDEVQEPLDELKNKVKDLTLDNAKLLLQMDNTKLANDDFKSKLEDETDARKVLEKDLEDLNKTLEESKLNRDQTEKEIDLLKTEIDRVELEHKNHVDDLREKIMASEVKVEIESQNSNLADVVNNIRQQYDKLAQKSLKETEDWYKSKFDNIKVEEAQNTQALQSGKTELKTLLKEKQALEIQIQTTYSMINSLERTADQTRDEYNMRLMPLCKVLANLENELKDIRSQVEHQVETNKNLLCVKMKLEAEINKYQQLIFGMTAEADRTADA